MRERIEAAIDRLPPSERNGAVAANPDAVIGATAAQLAGSAGVSQPTAVRFCRSLDSGGFGKPRQRRTRQ